MSFAHSNDEGFSPFAIDSQDGSSEEIIGEWMEARGNREQLVVATKVSYFVFMPGPHF